jgi:membrane protein insertase Oxa1/YidC/SpoIIIJ
MGGFWHNELVVPLLNVLIWLYNTAAFGNLGVAVIEMTILLRLVLMPLTVVSEVDEIKYEKLETEVEGILEHFKNDRVQAHEEVRALLKKHRISPWAKMSVMLIQLVALVVLYKVFVSGINANLGGLYSWVRFPELPINTKFFGFEIGAHNVWWAIAVGVTVYVDIVLEQKQVAHLLGRRDAFFRYAFPLFTIVILSLLPMVKSIFILTSMAFSATVTLIRRTIWRTG